VARARRDQRPNRRRTTGRTSASGGRAVIPRRPQRAPRLAPAERRRSSSHVGELLITVWRRGPADESEAHQHRAASGGLVAGNIAEHTAADARFYPPPWGCSERRSTLRSLLSRE
jgi:hypothetical protein